MAEWTWLAHQPQFPVSMALLLTSGNVLCQAADSNQWWVLKPDPSGQYVNGAWEQRRAGPHGPRYYASAVLADGTVFLAGGEYDFGREIDLCAATIYDPVADIWTSLAPPSSWTQIGDAPCCVLPDGKVLLGSIESNRCAIFDPTTREFSETGAKSNENSNEETWTLLPDGSVLTVECNGHPASERYVNGKWRREWITPVELVDRASIEIGPAVLLPNGKVFAIGATGLTAIYTPDPNPDVYGTWEAGPSFPVDASNQQLGAKDAPACLLPDGRVLCAVGPVDGIKENYNAPTTFFEYDPDQPPAAALRDALPEQPGNNYRAPSAGVLLLLPSTPSTEVLFINGTYDVMIYRPDGGPKPEWLPIIDQCPSPLIPGRNYPIQGRQFNGLSQACAYGDDAALATNYPLVRVRSAANAVRYCRTFGHSTMAVASKNPVSTNFVVPDDLAAGKYQLCVVANGIASKEITVTVGAAPA